MGNIISFMHISLDGFVAGPKGEMDWIKVNEEIFEHVGNRIEKSDTALYGRVTFQMMESYWPTAADKPNASKHDIDHSKWYKKVNKVVLSKSLKSEDFTNTKIITENLTENIQKLRETSENDILLFGSPGATHALMNENLIDGYWLFVNPIILGEGIPLFANIKDRIKLNLTNSQVFSCGVTELSYTVLK